MTLALYGKSRRRQGLLVVLALFAVFVAVIAGTAVQRTDRVSAAPVAIDTSTFTGNNSGTVGDGWSETETANRQSNAARLQSNNAAIYKVISTVGYTSIYVTFECRGDTQNGSNDYLEVQYSTNGGSSWTTEATYSTDENNANADNCRDRDPYTSKTVSFPASANNNSQFALRFRSQGHSGSDEEVRVDNVVLMGEAAPQTPQQKCEGGDIAACIELLGPVPAPQPQPANVCSGVNANFVIDVSASLDSGELSAMKSGIQSFSNILGTSSKYSAVKYAASTANVTNGYVEQGAFHTAIGNMNSDGVGLYTWTEGGIDAGAANNANPAGGRPHVMFVVTDGSPNRTSAGDNSNLDLRMTWVNAAIEAINAANNARSNYWVRVVRAGPADSNMNTAFPDPTTRQQFADAVMERLSAGSVVASNFDNLATSLLEAAGCDPNVLKSEVGVVNNGTQAEWTITLVNPSASPVTLTVTDAGATIHNQVPANACASTNLTAGASCTIPAKSGATNGQVTLTVRTDLPTYNVCVGTSVNNTVTVSGTNIEGDADATLNIPGNPQHPSCLGTIVVHKTHDGAFTNPNWEFTLNGGNAQGMNGQGSATWSSLTPGSYTVAETGATATACTPQSAPGAFETFVGYGATEQAAKDAAVGNLGGSYSGINLTEGSVHHVAFINKPCVRPDVKIEKSVGAATYEVGQNVSFSLKVTNLGPGAAHDVVVTDTLDGDITWNTPNGCSINAGTLTCNLGTLAEGDAGAVTINLTGATSLDNPVSCGLLNNVASVSASNEDPNKLGNNNSGVSTTVLCPNLAITKAPFPANGQATIGDTVGFDIVVTNNGDGTATNVTVSDQLPNAGLVWGDQPGYLNTVWANPNTPSGGCSLPTNGNLVCNSMTLEPGQSVTIQARARILTNTRLACTTHVNDFATATVGSQVKNSNSAQFTVNCPSVTISKQANPAGPVYSGQGIGFTLTVQNTTSVAANGVTVSDTLPATPGVTWSTATPGCSINSNVLSCTLNVAANGSVAVNITGTTTVGTTCGPVTNPNASATLLGATVNSGPATVVVLCPDPSVEKTGNGPITAGDNLVFEITVTPGGTGSQNVTLTDTLPGGAGTTWTVSGDTTGVGNCIPGPLAGGSVLSCTWNDLVSSRTITLTAPSTPAMCGPSGIPNTATITSQYDINTNNNTSDDTIVVNCPNVTLAKTSPQSANGVNAGEDITFTITATNSGAGEARNFAINDPLPGGINWQITSQNPAAACDINGGTLECGPTTLAANGGTLSVTITGASTPAVCGTVSNTATASASNHGPITPANADVSVRCPDVTVNKVADPGTINAGENAVFNITIDNVGLGVAKNVIVTDVLQGAGLTWTVTAPDGVTCTSTGPSTSEHLSGETLTCVIGDLAGTAPNPVITLSAPTSNPADCGPLSNGATVSAGNEATAQQGNNQSLATVNVNCAEIGFVKNTSTPAVSATDDISFTIDVTNPGSGTAFNVVVTDELPSTGLTWTLSGADAASCTTPGGAPHTSGETLTCSFGNMAQNATRSVTLTATTTREQCGEIENVASLTSDNAGTATSSAKVTVNCPSITVEKTSTGPNPVDAGGDLAYDIAVTVSGPAGTVAKNVVLKEEVPANTSGWTLVGITGDDLQNGSCTQILNSIICDFGNLTIPADGQLDYLIQLTARAIGPGGAVTCGGDGLVNWAIVQSGNAPEARDSATVQVNCPDVTGTKVATDETISAGEQASYTIEVTNGGAGKALNVMVRDDVSATGLSWAVSSDPAGLDCTPNPVTGELVCLIPELAANTTVKIHLTATTTPAVCGDIVNSASITVGNSGSTEPVVAGPATITVECPDVTVDKEPDSGDASASVTAGGDATFVITVRNEGPGTATNVTLDDQLPLADVLDWALVSGLPTECSIDANDVLSCSWTSLADDAEVTITVRATTPVGICEGAPEGGLQVNLDNTATVAASNEPDAATENNTDTGEITVNCADVTVEKLAVDATIGYFDPASYTIEVWNEGPGVASNVKVVDTLPANVDGWTTDNGACSVVPGDGDAPDTLECEFASLEVGRDNSVTVGLTSLDTTGVQVCGPIVNDVAVSAENEPSSAEGNNTATATINVECGTIQVIKIDNVPGTTPNLPAAWEFTITGPNGFNEVRTIDLGGGNVTIPGVPLGAGYAAAETQALGACPTTPSDATWTTSANPADAQDLLEANTTITFTFTNNPCGAVLNTGTLVVEKVRDINGNGTQDGGDSLLSSWPVTVTGPQFPGGTQFLTDASGRVVLPGILAGSYTVTEGSLPGYAIVGVRTNGGALTVANTSTVEVVFAEEDVVTFYNQPRGSITVTKSTVVSTNNGVPVAAPNDDDGWQITVTSAACGINITQATGQNGQTTFTNLPICSDYTVSENPVNPSAPGYTPVGATTLTNVTPGEGSATSVTFVNRRDVFEGCTNIADCGPTTVTPSPTTPPETPTNTPTNTPPASTNTPTNTPEDPATATPTPEEDVEGERTPGPASPTPKAPATGGGILGGPVGGANFALVLTGLAAFATGMFVLGVSRRRGTSR